jgi:hypothetical protein
MYPHTLIFAAVLSAAVPFAPVAQAKEKEPTAIFEIGGGCGDGFTDAVVGTDDGFEAFEGGVGTSGLVSVFEGLVAFHQKSGACGAGLLDDRPPNLRRSTSRPYGEIRRRCRAGCRRPARLLEKPPRPSVPSCASRRWRQRRFAGPRRPILCPKRPL